MDLLGLIRFLEGMELCSIDFAPNSTINGLNGIWVTCFAVYPASDLLISCEESRNKAQMHNFLDDLRKWVVLGTGIQCVICKPE